MSACIGPGRERAGCGGSEPETDAALAGLAASGAPLRRALARLAARFVALRGWEALGFVRAGDWARERVGLSGRELHDLARTDAALVRLPLIEAAFVAGRISWTKARLLGRVASAEDEAVWLARAERVSAATLAREVRAIDRGCLEAGGGSDETGAPEEACETLRIPCADRVSAKWGGARYLARRVAGRWLSMAELAEQVTAEALSGLLPLEVDPEALPSLPSGTRPPGPADAPAVPLAPVAASAPLPFEAALTEGLEAADPRELDARLRRAVALERGRLARMGPWLLELATARAYRDLGFRSLDAYARERLGMAPRKARALVRLERACCASPALAAAWREGALTSSQAQTLVAVVLAEGSARWVAAWVERAGRVTLRRLEDDVDHALATGELDPSALPPLPGPPPAPDAPDPAGVQTGARPMHGRERNRVRIHAPVEVVRLLRASLFTIQRRIERRAGRTSSPGEALEALLDHVLETWSRQEHPLPREHRVFARDGWRCTVPGCSSYASLHAHHLRFRSAGGGDELANLTTLCAAHHLRGVHAPSPAGRIRIHGRAPGRLRFETPLGSWAAGDVALDEPTGNSARKPWRPQAAAQVPPRPSF